MPAWKEKKGWRYRFQFQGTKYNKAWFRTKAEAEAAEAEHRKALKKADKSPTPLTFLELVNEYLLWSEKRHASKTWRYKRFVYKSFLAHAGNLPVERISLPVIESYLYTRNSNCNFNRHLKDLRCLFRWARRRGFIVSDPCQELERLPEPQFVRVIPTPEEMAKILLAAGEYRPFLLVLYHTMARIDEIQRLRWQDVNFEHRTIQLWTRKRRDGSWAADTLPMNQVLYDTLMGLWRQRQGEFVFVNPRTGERFLRRRFLKGICLKAGVRVFGFHAIRHYVASLLHDKEKISLPQVSKLLRHKSKQTTERYLQVIEPSSRDAMAALENSHLPMQPSHSKK